MFAPTRKLLQHSVGKWQKNKLNSFVIIPSSATIFTLRLLSDIAEFGSQDSRLVRWKVPCVEDDTRLASGSPQLPLNVAHFVRQWNCKLCVSRHRAAIIASARTPLSVRRRSYSGHLRPAATSGARRRQCRTLSGELRKSTVRFDRQTKSAGTLPDDVHK